VRSLGGGGGTLILKFVHEILSVDKIGESLARSGKATGSGLGHIFCEERESGIESTASSLRSAAFLWNDHTGVRTKPFRAADEKIPLSVVLVNKKPQYLVFCLQSEHQVTKQRGLPVESCIRPCGARIPAARTASNPVQARFCRPKPATRISVVLGGSMRKTQGRCSLGAELCRCGDSGTDFGRRDSVLEMRLCGDHLLMQDAYDTNPTRLQPVEDDVLALLVPVKA
jgi:hypothetical protein